MDEAICDVEGLESAVGGRPLAVLMKSITGLDEHCEAILGRSTAAALVRWDAAGVVRASVIGGQAGFAQPESPTRLSFDNPIPAGDGDDSAALVFFTPGWRETLRVNGQISRDGLAVEETFVHCGKAMIRSDFWSAPDAGPNSDATGTSDRILDVQREFLTSARFVVIGSCDASGRADASPKGDPAGFVQVLDDRTLAIPDRPGNRRTDTFHNVVENPIVSLLAIAPGDDRTLEVRGRVRLTTDAALLATMAVNAKVPKIALLLDVEHSELAESASIRDASLWSQANHIAEGELPRAARIWADHVKHNDTKGIAARAIRTGATETALRAGVAMDYRQNLY